MLLRRWLTRLRGDLIASGLSELIKGGRLQLNYEPTSANGDKDRQVRNAGVDWREMSLLTDSTWMLAHGRRLSWCNPTRTLSRSRTAWWDHRRSINRRHVYTNDWYQTYRRPRPPRMLGGYRGPSPWKNGRLSGLRVTSACRLMWKTRCARENRSPPLSLVVNAGTSVKRGIVYQKRGML